MAVVFTDNQYYQDIADAIRSKNGSSDTYLPSEMAAAIEDISGGGSSGGGGSASDPVKFIDYDGTILHSYSVADFMALTAMPENPSHSGLTAQGWNWSLADAKAQLTAMPEAGLTIGQMYITDDGKTRIYVHFEEARKSPYFGICPNGTVTVDWGDGSATDTLTGKSLTTVKTVQHEFPSAGDYVITLTVESGEFAFYGVTSTSHIFKVSELTSAYINNVYTNAVQKVELGHEANIGNNAFSHCSSLKVITIPSSITTIGTGAFTYCHLASLVFPSSVATIPSNVFSYCYSLTTVAIPNSVTKIGGETFNFCNALTSLTIPNNVTQIGNTAFYGCYSLTSLTLPRAIQLLGNQIFYNCSALRALIIPPNVTSIGSSCFYYCFSITSLTIPEGVASIARQGFYGCYGIKEYHFLPTTPPTLATTNAFANIPSDCIIYVPQGCLEAYQTATNWSTYASKMREEPAS